MDELTDLRTAIGRAFAYENWIKMKVMQALIGTEGELGDILAANQARAAEAADTVVMALSEIYWVKLQDDETADSFAARMKVKFDKEIDDEIVTIVETDIEIPDLPMNAAPSTVNALRLLNEFDATLEYQLTWAQWLMDMLFDCCDDIEAAYELVMANNDQRRIDAVERVTVVLTELIALEAEEGDDPNEFATTKRFAFEAAQLDAETATDVVETNIVIDDAPVHCQDSTYDAKDALELFSENLSDLLTYLNWLEAQLADSCDDLAADFGVESSDLQATLDTKEGELTTTLENLYELREAQNEDFADFAIRIRGLFDADEDVVSEDGGFEAATVPENCDDATSEAAAAYQLVIADYDDCLTYQKWVEARLVGECDDHAATC